MPVLTDPPPDRPPVVDLFRGRNSVRWPGERLMLALCTLFAPLTIGLITFALHEQVAGSGLGILVVVAFAYTALARGRLFGTSIRVHENQLPNVFATVQSCARLLGVSMPQIFVREDLRVPLVAIGLREPYALIISTIWLPQLKQGELEFLVGRELGHIYARHARFTSLLSSAGADNPVLGLVMGPWLRRTEYTADRVGLLCCGSCETAARAILITQFQHVAGTIDARSFISQREEIETDPSLRSGEWISREPYATHRIHELEVFANSQLYKYWRNRLAAWLLVRDAPLYAERKRSTLPGVCVLDFGFILVVGSYLKASHSVVVWLDEGDVQVIAGFIRAHLPWLAEQLGPHPTRQSMQDLLAGIGAYTVAFILFIIMSLILRRTPGMFVLGTQGKRPRTLGQGAMHS